MASQPGHSPDLNGPLEFEPEIPARNSKFYNADSAKRNRHDVRIAANSLSVKDGVCSICRRIFSDEHWRISQSLIELVDFPYHGSNAFAIAASARAGCGVCRLFRQALIERELFPSITDRSSRLYLHLEPWEEGGMGKCYLAWTIFARQPSLMTTEPLTLFAISESQPSLLEKEGAREINDESNNLVNYPTKLPSNNREAMWLAKAWVDSCEASHELCRAQREKYSTMTPTRLMGMFLPLYNGFMRFERLRGNAGY